MFEDFNLVAANLDISVDDVGRLLYCVAGWRDAIFEQSCSNSSIMTRHFAILTASNISVSKCVYTPMRQKKGITFLLRQNLLIRNVI